MFKCIHSFSQLKGNDEIVIAKVDATTNEFSKQFEVKGFPTIYWAPKDKSKSKKYEVTTTSCSKNFIYSFQTEIVVKYFSNKFFKIFFK